MNSCVKAVGETLSVVHLWKGLFDKMLKTNIYVDTSACRGIVMRVGSGRVKHLSTKQVWVQSLLDNYPMTVQNISRWDNCSYVFTHSVPGREGRRQLEDMGFHNENEDDM